MPPAAGFNAGVYEGVDDTAEDSNQFPEMYHASMILNFFMQNPMVDCDLKTLVNLDEEEEEELIKNQEEEDDEEDFIMQIKTRRRGLFTCRRSRSVFK
jgi:hypothetical protein